MELKQVFFFFNLKRKVKKRKEKEKKKVFSLFTSRTECPSPIFSSSSREPKFSPTWPRQGLKET
jgi:hypothetical protein